MQSIRARLAAIGVVVALLTASVASAFAAAPKHACPADQHACCQGARLAPCCDNESEQGTPSSTPASARLGVNPAGAPVALLPWQLPDAAMLADLVRPEFIRPPGVDLPTLLSTLRI